MYCVAIDPGSNGGIVEIDTRTMKVSARKMPSSTKEIYWALKTYARTQCFVLMEEQHARPSRFLEAIEPETNRFMKVPVASGATSAWTFAQHYGEIRGILTALEIPFMVMPPKTWMKGCGLRKKERGEKQTAWKNYLKERAQQMYPGTKVTLAVADALLMADLCHRLYGKDQIADPYADI